MPYCPNEAVFPFSIGPPHNIQMLSLSTPDPIPPPKLSFLEMASRTPPPTTTTVKTTTVKKSTVVTTPVHVGRLKPGGQAGLDCDTIENRLATENWGGRRGFGPEIVITTKLIWSNRDCQSLYLYLKDKYHDTKTNDGLYYYFGAIGRWGKAGFRISAHSKHSSRIGTSTTYTVLHIGN